MANLYSVTLCIDPVTFIYCIYCLIMAGLHYINVLIMAILNLFCISHAPRSILSYVVSRIRICMRTHAYADIRGMQTCIMSLILVI